MAISLNRRRAIYAAYAGVCQYCGAVGATHVDHIVPRIDGGTDDLGNLTLACPFCNISKSGWRLPRDKEAEMLALAETKRQIVLDYEHDGVPVADRKGGPPDQVTVMMTASMRKAIRRWRFENEIASEGEAIRELLRLGIAAQERS